ncbi:MAG: ribosome-associated translation inhibitor RaiA [Candidatus Zixiibacteriota bacterium]|nr:MAG: ribosome-associated translation inhibitor RaiA [candidate division Zixibacteria bacterium]
MKKKITARHFDLTPEMKARAEDEIEGLTRFFDNIISAEFTLDAERHRRSAELRVKVYNQTLAGSEETDDIYTAMSGAVDKVKGQLKRYKGKLRERNVEEVAELKDSTTRPDTDVDAVE